MAVEITAKACGQARDSEKIVAAFQAPG